MALDAATLEFLNGMAATAGPDAKPLWELSPAEARSASAGMTDLYGKGPLMQHTEEVALEASDGNNFTIRIHVPHSAPSAVLVYLHGGGWVLGDIDGYDTLARQLAAKSGAAVVLVNYRKAPEHPFPAPVEDAWTTLQWTAENLERIAGSQVPLFVAGDSAGGNLAAVAALRARENAGPKLAGQILVCPATDADFSRGSFTEAENQFFLTPELMRWFWNHYVPSEAERMHPEVAPLHALSLSKLPPALVITAEHDILRDEGEEYADRLRQAGVPVEHHRWPGQIHPFFSLVNVLPASAEAIDLIGDRVRAGSFSPSAAGPSVKDA